MYRIDLTVLTEQGEMVRIVADGSASFVKRNGKSQLQVESMGGVGVLRLLRSNRQDVSLSVTKLRQAAVLMRWAWKLRTCNVRLHAPCRDGIIWLYSELH